MMYMVAKLCSNHNHRSCGCRTDNHLLEHSKEAEISQSPLSESDLRKLEIGSPLRLTKSIIKRQGKVTFCFFHLFR